MAFPIRILALLPLLAGCGEQPPPAGTATQAATTLNFDSALHRPKMKPVTLNARDQNNLKQGAWQVIEHGKIKGYETYLNDTLHGPYSFWINDPGQYHSGWYNKGQKDGFMKIYDDSTLTALVRFERGVQIYMAFPVDAQYPKPVKGFGMAHDSVFVSCPYDNDTLWYTGLFLHKKPVGIHRTFYPNGQLKFEYDYATLMVTAYDPQGKLRYRKKDDGRLMQ